MGNFNIPLKRTGGVKPDGIYKLKIEKVEPKEGPKGPYLAMNLKFDRSGGMIFHNLSMGDANRFRVEEFLDAIEAPATGNMSARQLVGKTVWAKVGNESYQGRPKNIVSNFLSEDVATQLRSEESRTMEEDLETSLPPEEEEDSEDTAPSGAEGEEDEFPF